jgi:predicted transcriptional regulator
VSEPFERSPEGARIARPLERAWVRRRLVRDLATEEHTQSQLADQYGVTASAISNFKSRHRSEIEDVRRTLEDEFAGLWIARKELRLATLQQDVEDLGDSLEVDVVKVRHAALRQAADELGQIPSRAGIHVQNSTVTFQVEGVDLETCK